MISEIVDNKNIKILQDITVCPSCLNRLKWSGLDAVCSYCDVSYENVKGIPVIAKNKTFYYGEIPKDILDSVLRDKSHKSIFDNLRSHLSDLPFSLANLIFEYALAPMRYPWHFLLNLTKNDTVLDLGCGWGTSSIFLAKHVGCVVAADLTLPRLEFLAKRCVEEKIPNVIPLCTGDHQERLPFQSHSIDKVILNGLLEWIPESRLGDPRSLQLRFLQEIERILSVNGQLYIGIENRFGIGYLAGHAEDHTGLHFGSLLPRKVANIYSKLVRGKPYRTYTYSYRGYKRMLREAGMESTRVYGCVPNYRFPSRIADCEGDWLSYVYGGRRSLKPLQRTILNHLGASVLAKEIIPSFMIISSPKGSTSSLLEHFVLNHLGTHSKISFITGSTTATILARATNQQGKSFVFRLGITNSGNERIEQNWQALTTLKKVLSDNFLGMLPSPMIRDMINGCNVTVETALGSGKVDSEFKCNKKGNQNALTWLSMFHRATSKEVFIDSSTLHQLVGKYLDHLNIINISDRFNSSISKITSFFEKLLLNKTLTLSCIHGDFWSSNILYQNPENLNIGVVDWDDWEEMNVPAIDLLHYSSLNITLMKKREALTG